MKKDTHRTEQMEMEKKFNDAVMPPVGYLIGPRPNGSDVVLSHF